MAETTAGTTLLSRRETVLGASGAVLLTLLYRVAEGGWRGSIRRAR